MKTTVTLILSCALLALAARPFVVDKIDPEAAGMRQARLAHACGLRIDLVDYEWAGGQRQQRTAKDKSNGCLHSSHRLNLILTDLLSTRAQLGSERPARRRSAPVAIAV